MKLDDLRHALEYELDEDRWQELVERLDLYVRAQLAGVDPTLRYPDLAQMLDGSVLLSQAYARLYELQLADVQDRLPAPTRSGQPDLSFLQISVVQWVRQTLQRIGGQLRLPLTPDLLALLQPPPDSALALRAAAGDAQYRFNAAEQPFSFEIDVSGDTATLTLSVTPAGRAWPELGGYTVTVESGGKRYTAVSDPFGTVRIEQIPRDALAQATIVIDEPS